MQSAQDRSAKNVSGPLHDARYRRILRAPDGKEIRPDNSVGRLFSDWLRDRHPAKCGSISYYVHKTAEWEGDARQYPFAILPLYIEFVDTVWIPEHAERYFATRDPAALPYLPKLLPSPTKPRVGMTRGIPRFGKSI
jgi:hypothetical protein